MVHELKTVARCALLNEAAFLAFCANEQPSGVFNDNDRMVTITATTDKVVEAAKVYGVPRLTGEEIRKQYGL